MGDFLSATEIIHHIDRSGNQDGVATLEEIQTRLPTQQTTALTDPNTNFYRSLQTLNRICGQSGNTFQMSAILRCPIIRNDTINLETLRKAETEFVRRGLNRIYNNPQSDDLIKKRYEEFLSFIEQNPIPLEIFIPVLENLFNGPLENNPLEIISLDLQKESLFQLSLYAAMWHLKYNVKAFAPEKLAKYPEWFRKKVSGFENNILERLKIWQLSPKIGVKDQTGPIYNYTSKKIVTPSSIPFPSILVNSLTIVWHECFHAYRSQQVDAEPMWIAERDATLVAAVALFKMKGITDANDKRLRETIRGLVTEILGSGTTKKDIEDHFKNFWITHLYALAFYQQQRDDMARLEAAMIGAFGRHIMGNAMRSPSIPSDWGKTYKERREYILGKKKEAEEQIRLIERLVYPWPYKDSTDRPIPFREMIKRLNTLAQNHSEGLTGEEYSKINFYLNDIYVYAYLLSAIDAYNVLLRNVDSRVPIERWPPISRFHDLPLSFQFQQENKWLFFFNYLR